jgi:hypothetical protein
MNKLKMTLLCLLSAAGASLSAMDFFPLAPGNNWMYRDTRTGSTFTIQIGASQVLMNQRVYHLVRGYMPEQLLVRMNEFNNLVYWDQDRERDILLTSFEIVPGGRFEAPKRICMQEGQVQEKRVADNEGRWNAIEIRYRTFSCADAGDLSEQHAENIGMVRRVVNTIAGPRTYDLIYARVGNQTISPRSTGNFSVTAMPGSEPGTWQATMRIHQGSGMPMKLRFPSGQEYDLKLRGTDGSISLDLVCRQVVHCCRA